MGNMKALHWGAVPALVLTLLLSAAGGRAEAQIITTVAGGGAGDGGPATSALLLTPTGVAVDGTLLLLENGPPSP